MRKLNAVKKLFTINNLSAKALPCINFIDYSCGTMDVTKRRVLEADLEVAVTGRLPW